MAYDENLAERIRQVFKQKRIFFTEKKMMGGLTFMVDDKMCVGLESNKSSKASRMMARVGEFAYEEALQREYASEMTFTGRPMKGFIHVDSLGLDMQEDLEEWIQLCLDYNPLAKKSQKKLKKQ
ncbi:MULTISPECIES: TfoX/Sxy family protein [unclassified Lentimicrobium]|uniref:TfoX/Sxy family protein n=1 Tax=unclassified Lentimicrobium TaxID=2677434 RepID=UPI001558042C|nr:MULTISPECIES: TfoX/Sxy family protein [unclassified Lentimicrobium]NPD45244.1 RNA methyltransferase [Lentimicrobium sp. S6]NPD85423.1 RNA methyltransferase [Lentimicrobium sp. L6]